MCPREFDRASLANAITARIEAVTRWVEYVEEHPPEVWGPQQNRLANSQLESARQTGLDAEHYRRIEEAAERTKPSETACDPERE